MVAQKMFGTALSFSYVHFLVIMATDSLASVSPMSVPIHSLLALQDVSLHG